MAIIFMFSLFSLFHPVLLSQDDLESNISKNCKPFHCGNLGEINIPFTNSSRPEYCGPFIVDGCNERIPSIQLEKRGRWFELEAISQANTILITDKELQRNLSSNSCESFNNNVSLPSDPYFSFQILSSLTLLKCKPTVHAPTHSYSNYTKCENFIIYYDIENPKLPRFPSDCSTLQLPANLSGSGSDIFQLLTARFYLEVNFRFECFKCATKGGRCQFNKGGNVQCFDANGNLLDQKTGKSLRLSLGLSFGIGGFAALMIISSAIIIIRRRNKRSCSSSRRFSTSTNSDLSESDIDGGIVYLGIPVFSYAELKAATDNFHIEKEIGNGGYGAVYHGRLQDGREVAVKRLHEHNYTRVKQFMNEIKILNRLKHRNLVSLYGCASPRSRELLLVYEYIPNGTVADHLRGDRAKFDPLTWPIRMRIATETASALAYLHAADIIHRDVKTSNILLDKNFCVKVADFGFSKFFPGNTTHVSTSPQGTPGYVDPEYCQFYLLTAKSDVYSFGVVLIELVSSMPVIDVSRHKHEITLANYAVNKMLMGAFDELIDHRLGYKSNEEVKTMITLVAELAFLCLQQDQEMRPSMIEVFEQLKRIESRGSENLEDEHHSVEDLEVPKSIDLQPKSIDLQQLPTDNDVPLLKKIALHHFPTSPIPETDKNGSVLAVLPRGR